jgi:hypothetical protein
MNECILNLLKVSLEAHNENTYKGYHMKHSTLYHVHMI